MNKTEKQLLIYGLPSLAIALVSGFALWKINKQRIESEQTQQSQQNKSKVINEIKQESPHLERVQTIKRLKEKDAIKKQKDFEDDTEDFRDVMSVGGGGHRSKQHITQKSKTIRKHRKENKKQGTKNLGRIYFS